MMGTIIKIFEILTILSIFLCQFVNSLTVNDQGNEDQNKNQTLVTTSSIRDLDNATSKICVTADCQEAAKRLLDFMDLEANPCEDFYQFSCGNYKWQDTVSKDLRFVNVFAEKFKGYVEKNLLKIYESEIQDTDSRTVGMMKRFYQECTNNDRTKVTEVFKNYFSKAGGWPVVSGKNWSEENFDYPKTFRILRESFVDDMTFFGMFSKYMPTENIDDILNMLVKFTSGYANDHSFSSKKVEQMAKVAIQFGADPETAKKDMADVLKFDLQIVKLLAKRSQRIMDKNSHLKKVSFETVKTKALAELVDPDPEIKFIRDNAPARVKANHLFYSALASVLYYVIPNFDDSPVMQKYHSKKSFCWSLMGDIFDRAERAIWVKNFGEPRGTEVARGIGEKVKVQYLKILAESGYPEEVMKNVTEMHEHLKINYGNEFEVNDDYLENYYGQLVSEGASFFEIALAMGKLKRGQHCRAFRRSEMYVFAEAHIYGRPPNVQFSVPVMETPFVSPDYPPALNYGHFGFLFAHEWAHALEALALARSDKTLKNWRCLVDQYSNYRISGYNFTVSGEITGIENFADNAGVIAAYNAFRAESNLLDAGSQGLPGLNYTAEQLFWINYANGECSKFRDEKTEREQLIFERHAPPKLRVNVPLSNMEEFSKDFRCKLGSKMNPVEKCKAL